MSEIDKIKTLEKEQLDELYKITKMLNSITLESALFEESLDIVIKVLNAERALFVKYEPVKEKFSIVAARNFYQENIDDLSNFSSGILKKVVELKKPFLYHDVQNAPDISDFKSVIIHNIKSVVGVPIISEDSVEGVILADSQKYRKEFTEDNLLFLDFLSNLISLALDKIKRFEEVSDENRILKSQINSFSRINEIIGNSNAIKELTKLIHKVAKTDATVLILGESGTGKELVARAIHNLSTRNKKPMLAQFCGSIPDTLLESELFGFKKGAFTGANADKKGLFEVANNGTFFLDEIADISLALQAKLLRVLQSKEIIRIGDTQPINIDVRIITATNKDLKQLVKEEKFREDLFYRLNVFPIFIPPLREREGDITLLTEYFAKKYFSREVKIKTESIRKLEGYSWPGNVRQLENVIQRASILCDEDVLLPEHIIIEDEDNNNVDFRGTLAEFEKMLLLKRLKELKWNGTHTAKSLDVSVRWVQMKLKEMGHDTDE